MTHKVVRTDSNADIEDVREKLAPSAALEFVLALARHRAAEDHRNAKLTTTETSKTK